MPATTETFPERLRRLRLERALTQLDLAEAAGVSRSVIVSMENGDHSPRPTTVRKIARALGVKLTQLTVG